MRGSDRAILLLLPLVAGIVAVWILVISPKRAEEGDLKDQVAALQSEADAVEGQAAAAELARKDFDENYSALVALGAAAPADDDQSTLVYTLADIANENDLRFSGFTLSETPQGVDETTVAATPTPSTTETGTEGETTAGSPESGATGTESTSTSTTTTTSTAVPTEAAASTLPLGAAVGAAGFPVSSYSFSLQGRYFHAADFLADVDKLVEASPADGPKVNGRLLTIDGFSLSLQELADFPQITANLAVRTYEVPPEQGLEAGATNAGPAPTGTTTDSTTTTSTGTPTATVTP